MIPLLLFVEAGKDGEDNCNFREDGIEKNLGVLTILAVEAVEFIGEDQKRVIDDDAEGD